MRLGDTFDAPSQQDLDTFGTLVQDGVNASQQISLDDYNLARAKAGLLPVSASQIFPSANAPAPVALSAWIPLIVVGGLFLLAVKG